MSAMSDLGKMGISHSKKRNDLTRILWEWCPDNNMWLTTSLIPGKENTLADANDHIMRSFGPEKNSQHAFYGGAISLSSV